MPIKLSAAKPGGSIEEEIDKLRQKLSDTEGMTVQEIAEKINRTTANVSALIRRKHWSVMMRLAKSPQHILVNPKVLKRHQQKTPKT